MKCKNEMQKKHQQMAWCTWTILPIAPKKIYTHQIQKRYFEGIDGLEIPKITEKCFGENGKNPRGSNIMENG